jgi:hypothetical protein
MQCRPRLPSAALWHPPLALPLRKRSPKKHVQRAGRPRSSLLLLLLLLLPLLLSF